MAKAKGDGINNKLSDARIQQRKNKKTTIGNSKNSRPTHKQFTRNRKGRAM